MKILKKWKQKRLNAEFKANVRSINKIAFDMLGSVIHLSRREIIPVIKARSDNIIEVIEEFKTKGLIFSEDQINELVLYKEKKEKN